jgi:succinate dehydrogenase/fumarate reductase flavoprotein subunit
LRAKTVILCAGAAGRLGLPQSGYLWGTYENATNSGDGHAMAYHAGAGLANLECYQINPLIKDYNGPACAYVAGPFGAYTTNSENNRFIRQGPRLSEAQSSPERHDRQDRGSAA